MPLSADKEESTANGGSRPVPDPTVLTTQLIDRAMKAEREYVDSQLSVRDERLEAIDKATALRLEDIHKILPEVRILAVHERELTTEKFVSVEQQFKERDTRQERESRDNKLAVDAAFAAQEKQAAATNEANQKAIDKSEAATNESIKKADDTSKAANQALSDKIDDSKQRIANLEAQMVGMVQRTAGGRESVSDNRALGAYIMSGVLFLITVGSIILAVLAESGSVK